MGLLDFNMPGIDTPQGQGLLAAAFSLMGAKGNSMAEAIGDAGNKYMGVYQNARSLDDQKKLRDLQMKQAQMQMDEAQRALDERTWMREAAKRYSKPAGVTTSMQPVNAPGDIGPNLFSKSPSNMVKPVETATPASFDTQGFAAEYMQRDPMAATEWVQKMTKPSFMSVAPGAAVLDERTGKVVFNNPDKTKENEFINLLRQSGVDPASPKGQQLLNAYIAKMATHAPAAMAVSYGSPVPVALPGGGVGYAQPGNREGAPPQLMTGPDNKPLLKPDTEKPVPVEFSRAVSGINELENSLVNYQKALKENGGFSPGAVGTKRANLKNAYTAVQMGLKNAMELGALAGPDVQILSGMISDPTDPRSAFLGTDGLHQQVADVNKYLTGRATALYEGHKIPLPDKYKGGVKDNSDPLGIRK